MKLARGVENALGELDESGRVLNDNTWSDSVPGRLRALVIGT